MNQLTQVPSREQLTAKLRTITNVGKRVRAARKQDPSRKDVIGLVMDEVSVFVGATRYCKQRICTSGLGGFPRGVVLYRYCYHTVPGKITSSRLYFGQFAPWLRADVDAELQSQAYQKWGACAMPFEDC